MKPKNYTALALALTLFLAGCATTFRPWILSEVEEGMARDQVVQLLGEPDSVETQDGTELLHYAYREDYNPPMADDNVHTPDAARSFEHKQMKRGSKEYHYVVKLVDGKVQGYKEVTE